MSEPGADRKIAHLQMIQGVINRMAGASSSIRGWAVTLVAAVFALGAKDARVAYFVLSGIPIVVFWILDGYFLSQEREFRHLYNEVRAMPDADIDFRMHRKTNTESWCHSMLAPVNVFFYGGLAMTAFVVSLVIVNLPAAGN